MTRRYDVGWDRQVAALQLVCEAARVRLAEIGITMRDASNPAERDFGPWFAVEFSRTDTHADYHMAITARLQMTAAVEKVHTVQFEATWRAEAWQGVSPSFHRVEGAAPVDAILFTYGSFERLVLALLRRAADAFPEQLENAGWDGFRPLPSWSGPVDHLVEVKRFFAREIEPWTGPAAGCSEAEVQALEDRLGWPLPLAYKQYLRFMGADRKGVFVGSDWFIDHAFLNVICGELADMNVDFTPATDTLTFMSHQGYIHGWMNLPITSDDPPVWFYSESTMGDTVTEYVRFTELLLAELRHMSYFTQRVRTRR